MKARRSKGSCQMIFFKPWREDASFPNFVEHPLRLTFISESSSSGLSGFRPVPAGLIRVPCLRCVVSSAAGSHFQALEATKGSSNNLYYFRSLLDSPDQQLEGMLPMPGTRVFISKSIALGSNGVGHGEALSLKWCSFI